MKEHVEDKLIESGKGIDNIQHNAFYKTNSWIFREGDRRAPKCWKVLIIRKFRTDRADLQNLSEES